MSDKAPDSVFQTASAVVREPDIADLASESVIIFDPTGTIRYWNPASEVLYGWPALAMLGQGIGHLAERTADESEHWRLLMLEGAWQGKVNRRTPSGETVCADVRQYVRFNGEGQPRDVVEYGRRSSNDDPENGADWHVPDRLMAASWELDVADATRWIAEIEALRRAGVTTDQQRLETLWLEVVQATRIIDVNERAARLVGGNRGPESMIGQSVAVFWPIEARGALADLIAQAVTGGTAFRTYRRQLPSDGILRDPLLTVWLPVSGGRPNRVFAAANGTADDDRSYLYLRASEARYRKLVHYMPVALWQVDASHMRNIYADLYSKEVRDFDAYLDEHPELIRKGAETVPVTDVNRSAVELFGGTTPYDLMRPVGYLFSETPDALRRVMIGRFNGKQNYSELIKVRSLDGRLLDVQFSVTYPNLRAELDVTIFSMTDVTERLKIESDLRQIQADFAHAARVATLGEMTTSIAHEVNQPLSAIVTNAEASLRWLSRKDPNFPKVKELTARIIASARRASDIVQRIRRMAAKRLPERTMLDLNDVVQESLLFVQHEIDRHVIRVTLDLDRNLPRLTGDRVQLQQVIVNLLVNSVQALEMRGEGERHIQLATRAEPGDTVAFTLRDTGPGIPPDDLERVFVGFFTTKESGVGVGLAICKSIVTEHGGAIAASNHPGGGALFRFTIPIVRD